VADPYEKTDKQYTITFYFLRLGWYSLISPVEFDIEICQDTFLIPRQKAQSVSEGQIPSIAPEAEESKLGKECVIPTNPNEAQIDKGKEIATPAVS